MTNALELFWRLFGQYALPALAITAAIIAVYWAARGFLSFSSILLFRYPVSIAVKIARRWMRIPILRRKLAAGTIECEGTVDMLARRVDIMSGFLQRRIERLRLERSPLGQVLFRQEPLLRELKHAENEEMRLLYSDRLVLESLSPRSELSERGMLNVSVNPVVQDMVAPGEVLRILLLGIQRGGGVADLATYHLSRQSYLANSIDIAEITQEWPESAKSEAKEILAELSDK